MEKQTMPVLVPDFYSEFHCVAADCRANCCTYPWNIYINKNNYKLLRSLKQPKWLAENFTRYIKRQESSLNNSQYALIRQGELGCAFQTEDGLCRIHADLGVEYLSSTCRDYPRTSTYILTSASGDMQMEQSLTISCEEVTRMLLQKQAAIQFDLTEVMYSVATFLGEQRFASNFLKNDGDRPLLAHYNTVRAVGIALLQNRDYTIEQRIILLAIYLDKLSQAEADDRPAHLPAVIDTFVKAVEERLYDKLLASGGGAVTATVISNIAAITAFSQNSLHPIVVRCNTGITTIDFPRRMDSYRTFMAGREHLLEHLLVMELFTKAMPFTNKRSITDCIQYMVSIFTIFRFMLGAYLGESPELTEAEFIDFVAFFGKSVLHSSGSFDTNIGLLKESGMDTLPHWISIVLG